MAGAQFRSRRRWWRRLGVVALVSLAFWIGARATKPSMTLPVARRSADVEQAARPPVEGSDAPPPPDSPQRPPAEAPSDPRVPDGSATHVVHRVRLLSIIDGAPLVGVPVRILPQRDESSSSVDGLPHERTTSGQGEADFPAARWFRIELADTSGVELVDPARIYGTRDTIEPGRAGREQHGAAWCAWVAPMVDLRIAVRFEDPLPDGTHPPRVSIGVRPLVPPWSLRPTAELGASRRRMWDLAMIRRQVPSQDVIELRVPAARDLRISVGAAGYVPAETTVDVTTAGPGSTPIVLVLRRGAVAAVTVVDEAGRPITNAFVGMVAKAEFPLEEFLSRREEAFALQRAHNLGMTLGENDTLGVAQLAYYMGSRKVNSVGVATIPQMAPGAAVYIRVRADGFATATRRIEEWERDVSASIVMHVPTRLVAKYVLVRDGRPVAAGARVELFERVDDMTLSDHVLTVGAGGTVAPEGVVPWRAYKAYVTQHEMARIIQGDVVFGDREEIDISAFE